MRENGGENVKIANLPQVKDFYQFSDALLPISYLFLDQFRPNIKYCGILNNIANNYMINNY